MNLLQVLKDSASVIYAKYIKDLSKNSIEDNEEILPIFYIGGSQTLPPPLSPKEEEEAIKKLSNKDEEARQLLVERNLRLVVYIAKKFENTGTGLEDLISIGTIGLMKAINTYDTSKNIKLATYSSLGTDTDSISRGLEDEVDKKLLKVAISKLSTREKNIMELRFGFITGNEKTQKEVADMLGISQSYISRLEKKIICKMKKEILSKTG